MLDAVLTHPSENPGLEPTGGSQSQSPSLLRADAPSVHQQHGLTSPPSNAGQGLGQDLTA